MSDGNIIAGQAAELEFVLVDADTGAPITSDDHAWNDVGGGITDELIVYASDGAGGHESIAVEIANLKEISKAALPGRWAFATTLAHPGLASWRTNVASADNDGLGSRSARIVAAPPDAAAIAAEVESVLASSHGAGMWDSAGGGGQPDARWRKNESLAEKRRATILIADGAGDPADARTAFVLGADVMVDPSTGAYATPGGQLLNATAPLVVADDVVEAVDQTDNELDLTGHGLLTGDGPIRLTTTGALPAGLATGTDYWIIRVNANSISLASSLANALAGTEIDITGAGSGVHTLVDAASTRRLIDGVWIYEASQAEINISGSYFGIRVAKAGFRTTTVAVELFERELDLDILSGYTPAQLTRLLVAVIAGPVLDFTTNSLVFKCPVTGIVRLTVTTGPTGRLTTVIGNLD